MLLDCDARRAWARGVLGVASLAVAATLLPARAQLPTGVPGGANSASGAAANQREDNERMEHKQAERRNEERERELVDDTNKLLALAQALQADVSKTNKNELSLDVLKRAEQIEKLAHSVREKMRGYY